METRRLPVVLALLLLPVPAWADRHTMECSSAISPEKEQSLAARVSCGVSAKKFYYSIRKGIPRLQQARPAGTAADLLGWGDPKTKATIFVVAELAEYIAGRDSGETLDGRLFGARFLFLGQKPVEPFFHVLGGQVRPTRSEAVPEDVTTDWTTAWVGGIGADLEVNPSLHTGIVPVLRVQLDAVHVNDWYPRVTFGVSFRFEGHD